MGALSLCISNELPDGADGAGPWITLRRKRLAHLPYQTGLPAVKSVLALDFIKTNLKLVQFPIFVKTKCISFSFGASIY